MPLKIEHSSNDFFRFLIYIFQSACYIQAKKTDEICDATSQEKKKVWAYVILLHVVSTSHLRDEPNMLKKRWFQSSTLILYDTLPLCCQDRDTNIPEWHFQDLPQEIQA